MTCERDSTDEFMSPFFDIFIVSGMGNERNFASGH